MAVGHALEEFQATVAPSVGGGVSYAIKRQPELDGGWVASHSQQS